MTRLWKIILVTCFLQFITFQVVAQIPVEPKLVINSLNENIIRLEEQNKILLSTNSDIRNSYYWALSFCATFLILFLGVNIYFFRNRFNEDKEFLLNKIQEKSKNIQISNLELINTEIMEFDRKLEASFNKKSEELTKAYKASVSSNLRAIQMLKVDVIDLKLQNTIAGGCKPNILTGYFRLAEETSKLGRGFDWKTSRCLVEARELLDIGIKLDSMEYPEIITFLNTLPEQFHDVVGEIRKYLS